MASRSNVPRLALMAALAVLLSGCYAHGTGRYPVHYGAGYAYQGVYRQAPYGHAPSGHAYDKRQHLKPRLQRQERGHRAAVRERTHRAEPTRRPESTQRPKSTQRLERSGQPRHNRNAQAPRQSRPQVQRRHDRNAQAPRRDRRGSADRKAKPQPSPTEGDGRGAEWRPGPTARDEGPRPGAEGGAR